MKNLGAVTTLLLLSCLVLLISVLPSLSGVFHHAFSPDSSFNDRPRNTYQSRRQPDHVNQTDDGNTGSPWTHPVICTPHIDALASILCIYTASTFNNDAGISIFTTPSMASTLKELPVNLSHFVPSQYLPAAPPYRVAAIPGKGHGLVATSSIQRHSPILHTHPVLVALIEETLSTDVRENYFRLAISQLPASTQKSYYDLVRLYNIEEFAAQDVVRANSFEIGLTSRSRSDHESRSRPDTKTDDNTNESDKHTIFNPDGSKTTMHAAIFPQAARLNHACNPNAMYYLDPSTLTHVVHATRDIQPGEEITISYISVMQNREARRRMLAEGFGFECQCERCLRDEKRSQEHGEVLESIGSHRAWLALYALDETIPGWEDIDIQESHVDEILTRYLAFFEEEGLEGFQDEAYQLAAITKWKSGRKESARDHGRKASEVMAIRFGERHADVERWRDLNGETVDEFIRRQTERV